jgi:hypothetical protein
LLGASNLVLGISTVIESARRAWGAPLDILAALGHGRSFGRESWFVARSLPGIVSCGLWDDLASRPPGPTAALVTDIGNDILYGETVERIAGWVRTCLERLAPVCERITVTQLPLEGLAGVGRGRFLLLRTVFFPRSGIGRDEAIIRAEELNRCVVNLAARYEARVVAPQPLWYGFDPVHIRMRHRGAAWQKIFSAWRNGEPQPRAAPCLRRWLMLCRLRPLRRRLFSVQQHQPQPAGRLSDGSTISLY